MDRHSEILDLCTIAENVLYQIPLEVADSREEHFAPRNLWSLEIESTCSQIIQYYRACGLLISQELPRPAAALARGIQEACYRFKYLAENECELKDWEHWQLAQNYQFVSLSLRHDLAPDDEVRPELERALERWKYLLDGAPTQRAHPWRPTSQIFQAVEADLPDGRGKALRRHVIGFFSAYVHFRRSVEPPLGLTIWSVGLPVLLTIRRGMVLCLEKGLLPVEAREMGSKIVTECERLLQS